MPFVVEYTFTIVSRCQGLVRAGVAMTAPQVDDQLAVERHGQRRADFSAREILLERGAHACEARGVLALDLDPVRHRHLHVLAVSADHTPRVGPTSGASSPAGR